MPLQLNILIINLEVKGCNTAGSLYCLQGFYEAEYGNKHLMTGPKGNSEFCFPETPNVPRGEAEGNIEVEGKQNSLFPERPVIKCFVIPPNSK